MKGVIKVIALLFIFSMIFLIRLYLERSSVYDSFDMDLKAIEGYTEKFSYSSDEDIHFMIHSEEEFHVQLYRMSDTLIKVGDPVSVAGVKQNPIFSPVSGYDWESSYKIKNQLASAYYYLMAWNSIDTSYIPFVSTGERKSEVVVVASTNTWQAYNSYGGKSFYSNSNDSRLLKTCYSWFPKTKPVDYLPQNRPLSFIEKELKGVKYGKEELNDFTGIEHFERIDIGSHLHKGEWNLVHFLESEDYDYSVISDYDFERAKGLDSVKTVIFNTHSEYWSQEMRGRLNELIEKGVNIVFASGNNMYREVEHYRDGLKVVKSPEYDRGEVSELIGTFYTEETYLKVAPYRIVNQGHWAFKGIESDTIGMYGASGFETDKISAYSKGFKTLAIGCNQSGPAYMVIKDYPNGNYIFNASSIMFSKGLTNDVDIKLLMTNLLSHE